MTKFNVDFSLEIGENQKVNKLMMDALEDIKVLHLDDVLDKAYLLDMSGYCGFSHTVDTPYLEKDVTLYVNTEDYAINLVLEPNAEEFEGYGYFVCVSIELPEDEVPHDESDEEIFDYIVKLLRDRNETITIKDLVELA